MLAAIPLCFALLLSGQEGGQGRRPEGQQPAAPPTSQASPITPGTAGASQGGQPRGALERPTPSPEEPPVITHHEIRAGGKVLRYTATTGMMPIKNREGETEARIFFMAYTLDDAGSRNRRPLTFSFNGGPGSASVWWPPGRLRRPAPPRT